jgi:cell division protein FtsW
MREKIKTLSAIGINKVAAALVVAVFFLLALGVVMLFSTSAFSSDRHVQASLQKQLIWVALGVAALLGACVLDYRKLRSWAVPLLIISLVLLVLVLVPHIGARINGARRWLQLGSQRFQPSELAKLAVVIFLAHLLAIQQRRIREFDMGFLWPMAALGVTCLLVFVEPDFGTTALIAAVGLTLMFVAGTRWVYLLPTVVLGTAAFALLISRDAERMNRMMAFANLDQHKEGAGYQLWQSLLAFGSGGASGLGLGNSGQKLGFLPEAHTDFIFAIVGEELGLAGTVSVVVAFAVLLVAGIWISVKAPDTFGVLLGLGITLTLTIQAAINIGVVTGALPTKGLSLPFISAGGSNLVVTMFEVGVLLNIFRHNSDEVSEVDHTEVSELAPAGI